MSNNRYILQFRRNNGYAESRDKAVELIKAELPKCKEGEAVLCKWKDGEKDGVLMGVSNGDGSYKYMDVDEVSSAAIPLKMAGDDVCYNVLGTPGGGGELSEAYDLSGFTYYQTPYNASITLSSTPYSYGEESSDHDYSASTLALSSSGYENLGLCFDAQYVRDFEEHLECGTTMVYVDNKIQMSPFSDPSTVNAPYITLSTKRAKNGSISKLTITPEQIFGDDLGITGKSIFVKSVDLDSGTFSNYYITNNSFSLGEPECWGLDYDHYSKKLGDNGYVFHPYIDIYSMNTKAEGGWGVVDARTVLMNDMVRTKQILLTDSLADSRSFNSYIISGLSYNGLSYSGEPVSYLSNNSFSFGYVGDTQPKETECLLQYNVNESIPGAIEITRWPNGQDEVSQLVIGPIALSDSKMGIKDPFSGNTHEAWTTDGGRAPLGLSVVNSLGSGTDYPLCYFSSDISSITSAVDGGPVESAMFGDLYYSPSASILSLSGKTNNALQLGVAYGPNNWILNYHGENGSYSDPDFVIHPNGIYAKSSNSPTAVYTTDGGIHETKTINGESILGEGDIEVNGGIEVVNRTDAAGSNTPLALFTTESPSGTVNQLALSGLYFSPYEGTLTIKASPSAGGGSITIGNHNKPVMSTPGGKSICIWTGTQAEYDRRSKSDDTLYFITED